MSNLKDQLVGRNIHDLNEQMYGPSQCNFGFEWRQVPWASKYFVSSSGEVASTVHGYLHKLKSWSNQYGHRYVGLTDDFGDRRKISVHRLVAELFINNDIPETNNVVRHLDDDPENNEADNLAWGTHMDNRRDCVEHERDFRKPVYCYETDKVYRSCAAAADEFGVSRGIISFCCQGKVHAVRGKYHFCYLSDKNDKEKDLEEWIRPRDGRKPVKAINVNDGEERVFDSIKEASEKLGVNGSSISNILAGRFYRTGNWTFKEVEDERI